MPTVRTSNPPGGHSTVRKTDDSSSEYRRPKSEADPQHREGIGGGLGSLLRAFQGHTGTVYSVHFSPDGHILASRSMERTVGVWPVSDGALLHTLQGHTGLVNSVAFSSEGKVLVSASNDRTVRLWRVRDGVLLNTLEGNTDNVNSVAFSPDGKTVASGSSDGSIRLWGILRE
jgi:WD40 repeat protein